MQKYFFLILLCSIISINFTTAFCAPQSETVATSSNSNYIIPKYVIGSGGVICPESYNYMYGATAGEPLVGILESDNYLICSGFWNPIFDLPTNLSQSDLIELPKSFAIYQNYPNPFNPQTTIKYDLPYECQVTVEIFNVMGQRLCQLNSEIQSPGYKQVLWHGRDEHAKVMGSGIYIYRVTALGTNNNNVVFQQTKKMLLVK